MIPVTIIVMYHYVQSAESHASGIFPLSPAEFDQQLDAMEAMGRIVPPAVLSGGRGETGGSVQFVLSFDDGTKDHYTNVFPRLQRRGLSGLFAVLSGPVLEGHIASTHLAHALLSRLSVEDLWNRLRRAFDDSMLGAADGAAWTYSRDTNECRRRAKYALNYALPATAARQFLLEVMAEKEEWLETIRSSWYLSECDIQEMAAGGMEFAVHGHHHEPWRAEIESYIADEIDPCRKWLGGLLGFPARHYVLPFGGKSAQPVNLPAAEPLLRDRGFARAHLSRPGVNPDGAYWLQRFDAADLPPRKPWPAEIGDLLKSSRGPRGPVDNDA